MGYTNAADLVATMQTLHPGQAEAMIASGELSPALVTELIEQTTAYPVPAGAAAPTDTLTPTREKNLIKLYQAQAKLDHAVATKADPTIQLNLIQDTLAQQNTTSVNWPTPPAAPHAVRRPGARGRPVLTLAQIQAPVEPKPTTDDVLQYNDECQALAAARTTANLKEDMTRATDDATPDQVRQQLLANATQRADLLAARNSLLANAVALAALPAQIRTDLTAVPASPTGNLTQQHLAEQNVLQALLAEK